MIEARPFNHIGPRQALGFVVPDFASQLAAIKLGQKQPVMSVGNLEAERDFTDVRDVAAAYVALAEKGHPGEAYFICSGKAVSIYSLLQTLTDLAQVEVQITFDPNRDAPFRYALSFWQLRQDRAAYRLAAADTFGTIIGRCFGMIG